MATQFNNLDILILGQSPDALSCARVLSSFSDLTIFRQDPGIPMDLIILASGDLYTNLELALKYPNANFLAIQQPLTDSAIGSYILCNINNTVGTDCSKDLLYKIVRLSAKYIQQLSKNKRTQLLNTVPGTESGLTYKEQAYLGALTRGLKISNIARLFNVTQKDVRINIYKALKTLGIKQVDFVSIDTLCKYGSVEPGPKHKHYIFPKSRVRKPGYYVIPKFLLEED